MLKDSFWEMMMPLGASFPFESIDEEDNYRYQALFDDHPKGMGISLGLSLLRMLRMRTENGEVPWSELLFKSKT